MLISNFADVKKAHSDRLILHKTAMAQYQEKLTALNAAMEANQDPLPAVPVKPPSLARLGPLLMDSFLERVLELFQEADEDNPAVTEAVDRLQTLELYEGTVETRLSTDLAVATVFRLTAKNTDTMASYKVTLRMSQHAAYLADLLLQLPWIELPETPLPLLSVVAMRPKVSAGR